MRAARELLEEDGNAGLSLRAVVRRVGDGPLPPYADRGALVSAVAAEGYRGLAGCLATAHPSSATADDLATVAVAYVRFALDHPAMFRVMFAEPCDPGNEERAAATVAVREYVRGIVRGAFPPPTRPPCRPWCGPSFTAWHSCTSTAHSTPPPPKRSPGRPAAPSTH